MPSRHLFSARAWALATAAVAAVSSPAYAQAARPYNIPAQPLAAALEAFGKQSGMEILFDRGQVAGKRSSAVTGTYTAADALARLTAGTGMRVQPVNGSTFVVSATGQGAPASDPAPRAQDVAEVVVTGSRLASNPNQVETRQYDKEVIAQSGQTSVANFLNSLPEVSVRSLGNTFTNYGAQDTVRLRGLPAGATLVLLDGRRVPTSTIGSSGAFDLNLLPTMLVERVDVLPVGSSAVYGSDAIGGVVNIITRKRYDGLQIEASYGFASKYEEKRVGLMWGMERDALSVVAALAANTRDALYGFDRELTASNDYSPWGGIDFRSRNCDPGTVTAVSGVLNGVGTATAAIPATGADNRANYRPGPGPLCSSFSLSPYVPRQAAGSATLAAQYRLDSGVTLYTQNLFAYTSNDTFGIRNATGRLVPASNAFNPFGQDVRVDTLWPVLSGNRMRAWTYRPLAGLRGPLGGSWDFDAVVWANRINERLQQEANANSAEQAALLASSNPATALNLFNPRANDPALLRRAFTHLTDRGRRNTAAASLVFRGTPFSLPGGDFELAVGAEYQDERFDFVVFNGGQESQRIENHSARRAGAVFAEFNAPLITGADGPMLSVSGAGRYDEYSDFGEAFTPQLGIEFRPGWGLSVRASYSEAFKAPELRFSASGRSVLEAPAGLFDPRRNEVIGMVRFLTGGNPGLRPETGESRAITVRWTPPALPDLQASATAFRITEEDRISFPSGAALVANENLFPGRVTRGPSTGGLPGPVTDIDLTYVNFGGLLVEGIDFSVRYRWATDLGVFSPFLSVTRTTKYESQVNIGQPFEDRLSKASFFDVWAPKWKGLAGVSWQGEFASASLQGRYTGRYLDYQLLPSTREIGDFVLVDVSAQVDLGRMTNWEVADGATLRVAVSNLLDQNLKFSQASILGFDAQQYDFIGRLATITLTKEF